MAYATLRWCSQHALISSQGPPRGHPGTPRAYSYAELTRSLRHPYALERVPPTGFSKGMDAHAYAGAYAKLTPLYATSA